MKTLLNKKTWQHVAGHNGHMYVCVSYLYILAVRQFNAVQQQKSNQNQTELKLRQENVCTRNVLCISRRLEYETEI